MLFAYEKKDVWHVLLEDGAYQTFPAKDKERLEKLAGTYEKKIFHDLKRHIHTLDKTGLTLQGPCYDIAIAEALLDEYLTDSSLKGLAKKYISPDIPPEALEQRPAFAIKKIWDAMQKEFQGTKLKECFYMECALVPFVAQMEKVGARLHLPTFKVLSQKLLDGIKEEKTPSFHKALSSFIEPYLTFLQKDRIYPTFLQVPTGEAGTVSGRFSCINPNLQQVPKALDFFTSHEGPPLSLRSCFIPEDGCQWGKIDYSHAEVRILAHYAQGPKAEDFRQKYRQDPSFDFYSALTTGSISRSVAKKSLLSILYGISKDSLKKELGLSLQEIAQIFFAIEKELPFLPSLMYLVQKRLKEKGYIESLAGRRHRLHPSRKPFSFFNRLLQGTCADVFKKSLLWAHREGLFEVLTPHVIVHDEVDISVPMTQEGKEAFERLQYIMEHTDLCVPMKVTAKLGKNWGECE